MFFSGWFLRKCEGNDDFLDSFWFTDEVHFHLDERAISQNYRLWSNEGADLVGHAPLHSAKYIAWCAMSFRGIIGPFWFEDDEGRTETINTQRYRSVLSKFWSALKIKL